MTERYRLGCRGKKDEIDAEYRGIGKKRIDATDHRDQKQCDNGKTHFRFQTFVRIWLQIDTFAIIKLRNYFTCGSSSEPFHTTFQVIQNTATQTTIPKSTSTKEEIDMPQLYFILRSGVGWTLLVTKDRHYQSGPLHVSWTTIVVNCLNQKVFDGPDACIVIGHGHQGQKNWRIKKREEKTKNIRPDLWKKYKKK